jgi:hypothetical protein
MVDFDPNFLGLPNKFISYALVTYLGYFFSLIIAANSQLKSFMVLDQVAILILITPVILASIYYCMKDLLNFSMNFHIIRYFLFLSTLIFSFVVLFSFILYFFNYITNFFYISQLMNSDTFRSSLWNIIYLFFLTISLYYCIDKNWKIKLIFLTLFFLLEGLLFLFSIDAIYRVNADPLDFVKPFILLLIVYLLIWSFVSIYIAILENKKNQKNISFSHAESNK